MSLINRMLDDLAARQAPGTESLQGVRLNEPLEAANLGIDRSRIVALLLVASAVAVCVWWLWPGRAEIAVPQARRAPAVIAQAVPVPAPSPQAAAPEVQVATSDDAIAPRLRLAPRLESFEAAPAPVAIASPVVAQPDAAPRSKRAKPAAPNAPSPPPRASPAITAPTAPAAPPAPTDPAVERRQRARQALADQDPATALVILDPADAAHDVESAALRAAALQRLGRHAEAADAYAALTTRDPAEPAHWVGLGISLEGERRRDPARIAYRRALQSDRLAPSLRAFAQDRVTVLEKP